MSRFAPALATTAAVLALCLVVAGLATRAQAASLAPLKIDSVALDGNQLTIVGRHFGSATPVVKIGDEALPVARVSETELLAEAYPLEPGVYSIEVSRDGGATSDGSARTTLLVR
jgi:hypothetical protein